MRSDPRGGRHVQSWWLFASPPNTGNWRDRAAYAGHPDVAATAWDDSLEGENETSVERAYRVELAISICHRCPVERECLADVDDFDRGVRGGVDLRQWRHGRKAS